MPMPSTLEVGYQDVDYDSGRTADGMMHRNRVAASKRKLNVGWPASKISSNLVKTVLNAVYPEKFTVTYLDPMKGEMMTGDFYVGDRVVPVYNYALGMYDAFSFGLVEY